MRGQILAVGILLLGSVEVPAAQLTPLPAPGPSLKGNPLGDPSERPVAVFSPDGTGSTQRLPLVIYLPGWGGSSADALAAGSKAWFGRVVDDLAARGTSLRIAVVDGRSRYGGSQYLNSLATGQYADYVCRDVVAVVTAAFGTDTDELLLAGHSSGGYGALILGMTHHETFHAVVALSPDSDFETTHKPLAQADAVRSLSGAELESAMATGANFHLPENGLARLIIGLSANYTPMVAHPGRFDWLYDAKGNWRPEIWQRWIDADPLTVARRQPDAFAPTQRVFLDGPDHDDFQANIGARKIYEVLASRPGAVKFEEPAGRHSDHLPERLEEGLTWALQK